MLMAIVFQTTRSHVEWAVGGVGGGGGLAGKSSRAAWSPGFSPRHALHIVSQFQPVPFNIYAQNCGLALVMCGGGHSATSNCGMMVSHARCQAGGRCAGVPVNMCWCQPERK